MTSMLSNVDMILIIYIYAHIAFKKVIPLIFQAEG
jgi:hypothetical protein